MLSLIVSLIVPSQIVKALEPRTDFKNRHETATFGNSHVCGDHLCGLGEKLQWTHATWDSQRLGTGKLPTTSHGEDIMSELAKASITAGFIQGNKTVSRK